MIGIVTTLNMISSTVNIQNQPIFKSQNLNDVNCTENQIIYAEIVNKEMTYSCRDDNFKQVAVGLGCYLGILICLFGGWIWFWFIKPTQQCSCCQQRASQINAVQ
ncbi:Hypothetical_protein [Hexamita inflata]|uniref:Hypothetical_protein n=1 Tax=Hexamita inflata TaxID=28002 RepID=A0AA86NC78_9EUKA|nr:Hypothetical protein HINF_LOCUS4178 [Hexamita inflata]